MFNWVALCALSILGNTPAFLRISKEVGLVEPICPPGHVKDLKGNSLDTLSTRPVSLS